MANLIQVQTCGRKLRNLPAAGGGQFDVKYLRSHEAASRTFVHGEEMAAQPVPAVVTVGIVDAHHDFQLWLAPEAGTVGRRQPNAGVEVSQLELSILAK